VEVRRPTGPSAFRLPVQLVIRPDQDFRGYAGQIASGSVSVGDALTVWPSGLSTRVTRIVTWDGDLETAAAPMSVTLVLADDIDVGRGDVLAREPIEIGRSFSAEVVWMDDRALDPSRTYVLKHASKTVPAEINRPLALNEIGPVTITTTRPIVFDRYADNRTMGSFVVIDPATNFTSGAGMIVRREPDVAVESSRTASARIAQAARAAAGEAEAIDAVRRLLEEILT
jgi:sulfate adenylyltransferase subunit 1 (EFTu-like GTPase family)